MPHKSNAHKAGSLRARKDIPRTVGSPREKVTLPSASDVASDWPVEDVLSQPAAVHYTPAVGETRTIPVHTLSKPRGFEGAIVSGLVSLARFTRRKPGTSLAIAAAAGLAAGFGVRRI